VLYTELEESDVDLARHQKWLAAIRARDYFDVPGGEEAVAAVASCEEALARFERMRCPRSSTIPRRTPGRLCAQPGPGRWSPSEADLRVGCRHGALAPRGWGWSLVRRWRRCPVRMVRRWGWRPSLWAALGPGQQEPARGVVDHEPGRMADRAWPEVAGVAHRDEDVGVAGRLDHNVLGAAARGHLPNGRIAEPGRGVVQERLGRLAGHVLQLRLELGAAAMAAEQPGERASRSLHWFLGSHVQQRDLGIRQRRDGVDAGGPAALRDPREDLYPISCSASHSATVAPIRMTGTVAMPRRRNVPRSGCSPRACSTRRHSSVAREPV